MADQFARDRGGHLGLGFARSRQATVALAQADLRLPSNRLDLIGQIDDAHAIAAFLASGQSVRPASLDQLGARMHVPTTTANTSSSRPPSTKTTMSLLRPQLRDGDVVVVWKLDRLSRTLKDMLHIMERIDVLG